MQPNSQIDRTEPNYGVRVDPQLRLDRKDDRDSPWRYPNVPESEVRWRRHHDTEEERMA